MSAGLGTAKPTAASDSGRDGADAPTGGRRWRTAASAAAHRSTAKTSSITLAFAASREASRR
jgi:hypothetical protein